MTGENGFRRQDLSGAVFGDATMSGGPSDGIGVTPKTYIRTSLKGVQGLWQNP
ncbi:hypothetical protein [Primorskyibacter flagellatus]|uniref:hypothetical protein n=1 Tax=Primorskyibacter flagellatus TaxID=1387277 RepID=UPI003A921E8C